VCVCVCVCVCVSVCHTLAFKMAKLLAVASIARDDEALAETVLQMGIIN